MFRYQLIDTTNNFLTKSYSERLSPFHNALHTPKFISCIYLFTQRLQK